jgi:acyl-CoA dehydrogenase
MLMGTTSPAFRYIYGANIGLGTRGLVIASTPEQKAKFLPKFASGEWVAAFAMTEPEAGSDAAKLKATARRKAIVISSMEPSASLLTHRVLT